MNQILGYVLSQMLNRSKQKYLKGQRVRWFKWAMKRFIRPLGVKQPRMTQINYIKFKTKTSEVSIEELENLKQSLWMNIFSPLNKRANMV